MSVRIVEGDVDYTEEDSGCAVIAEVGHDDDVFVRIQEWHPSSEDHTFVPSLHGKRVRVWIEVLDDAGS